MEINNLLVNAIVGCFCAILFIHILKGIKTFIPWVIEKVKNRAINKKVKEYAEYARRDAEITIKVGDLIAQEKPISICNDRVIWFNGLSTMEQRNFLDFIQHAGLDIDGDVVFLNEKERSTTLRELFPSEEVFYPEKKVVVRGVVSLHGRIINMCIVFQDL